MPFCVVFRKSLLGGKFDQLSKLRDLLQTKFVSDEYKNFFGSDTFGPIQSEIDKYKSKNAFRIIKSIGFHLDRIADQRDGVV